MARRKRTKKKRGGLSVRSAEELQRIEKLLDEDFESLSEARRALKAETGPVPNKKQYSVSELSSKKHRTVRTFIPDLESHTEEIDALKKPADYWAAEIYGNKTYSLYGSISGLANKLASYRGLQEEHPQQALKNIKIIRISGQNALDNYVAARRKATQESWKRTREKHKLDRKRQRKQRTLLKKMRAQIAAQKKVIRNLQKGK